MTLDELRIIVNDVKDKTESLSRATGSLRGFIDNVHSIINGEFSASIDVDTFVALQTPIYFQLLTEIETKSDALGTDPFH